MYREVWRRVYREVWRRGRHDLDNTGTLRMWKATGDTVYKLSCVDATAMDMLC